MTFVEPSGTDISTVEQFKAYVDGASKEPSCTVYDPSSKQPPYQCTIGGISLAKDYLIKIEYCTWGCSASYNHGQERMWTLPTCKPSTWVRADT